MQSSICIVAECGNSCFNVLAIVETSNIFFLGSYGEISLSVSNPELLHVVAVLVVKGSQRLVAI